MLFRGATLVKTSNCCDIVSRSGYVAEARAATGGPRALTRRCLNFARWMLPSGILALLPKCPACLAAYFALGTGIGISMSTAIYLRIAASGAVCGVAFLPCSEICSEPWAPLHRASGVITSFEDHISQVTLAQSANPFTLT